MDDYEKVLKELKDLAEAQEQSDIQKTIERNKLLQRLEKVSPALFGKFLAEKNASQVCLSCGSTKLSVPESRTIPKPSPADMHSKKSDEEKRQWLIAQMHPYVTPTFNQPNDFPRLGIVDYRVSCLNCGHVHTYRAAPAVEWVEWYLANFGGISHD